MALVFIHSRERPFLNFLFESTKKRCRKVPSFGFHFRKSNLSDFFSAPSGLSIEANYQIFEITVDFRKRLWKGNCAYGKIMNVDLQMFTPSA